MKPFQTLTATAIPLRLENVDTDQIIPAKYLTAVTKEGNGPGALLLDPLQRRRLAQVDFVLNQPEYREADILIAGRNFGSGSSREHAVWALTDYGFRCVIAPGFADIFYNNSLKNGLLPVTLPEEVVAMLWDLRRGGPGDDHLRGPDPPDGDAARRPAAQLCHRSIPQDVPAGGRGRSGIYHDERGRNRRL